ncbi:hypothetical protein [Alkaliphilus oremlandii]|uniref:RiboL-PSP-HEPN domain-containing protein n=1 Tax=Alkaliphilus oremlandii (strain OhILAs) TaxID=350688 RepID=A8MHX4_ALKOO|nr:hypothetical protein [Alkaliphilus oremlandii]ABW19406.1 hypothetical protein Clos_1866 [Alkaliphilus oremlandii OhILAs]
MRNIDEELKTIVDNGFKLESSKYELENLAFVSLRLALKAYYSTYKSNEMNIGAFINNERDIKEDPIIAHIKAYYENYFECIVHFQHFFELITKDILGKINKLLTVRVQNKYDILYKLINNIDLDVEEESKLISIEFSEVLKAFPQLNKEGFINSKHQIWAEDKKIRVLEKLNKLRNSIWHRGLYIVPYEELDIFIGKYILPLVKKVVEDTEYHKYQKIWKYEYVALGIEPLSKIIDLYESTNDFSDKKHIKKAAYLKEVGRAAYYNNMRKSEWESKDYKNDTGKIFHVGWAYFDKKSLILKVE